MRFRELRTRDGILATYSTGRGPALLFLHGGPGDTHHYLREVARELEGDFTCILYDQRGTGRSLLATKDANTLHYARFIEDIDAILDAYGLARARVFGHSWGAILGLHYGRERAARVERAALVSMGPLNDEYGRANSERLLAAMTPEERERFAELRAKRKAALAEGDTCRVSMLDNAMMPLRVKSWVHDPALRASYLDSYFAEPPVDRLVNKLAWESLPPVPDWSVFATATSPIWLCQGEQDANPLEQLRVLEKHLPSCRATVLPECGHIPWLEQSSRFYAEMRENL